MDINTFGIASMGAITVICYLCGLSVKAVGHIDRFIPCICGMVGGILGTLWFFMGWPGFVAEDPITAAAVGIVSGLAATGANQVYKQLSKEDEGN